MTPRESAAYSGGNILEPEKNELRNIFSENKVKKPNKRSGPESHIPEQLRATGITSALIDQATEEGVITKVEQEILQSVYEGNSLSDTTNRSSSLMRLQALRRYFRNAVAKMQKSYPGQVKPLGEQTNSEGNK